MTHLHGQLCYSVWAQSTLFQEGRSIFIVVHTLHIQLIGSMYVIKLGLLNALVNNSIKAKFKLGRK